MARALSVGSSQNALRTGRLLGSISVTLRAVEVIELGAKYVKSSLESVLPMFVLLAAWLLERLPKFVVGVVAADYAVERAFDVADLEEEGVGFQFSLFVRRLLAECVLRFYCWGGKFERESYVDES